MVELLFCLGVLAGVIALGMYKAPLWLWAAALALAAVIWQSAIHGQMGLFGFLLWLSAVAFGALAVPDIRRALLIAPAFKLVKDTMPKVSDTEAQALEAGTVGFDAELFSGTPDWDKLRSIAADRADARRSRPSSTGRRNELCRMIDDWQMRHNAARGAATRSGTS